MSQIKYKDIPFKEKQTKERIEENAFYMPKAPEPDYYAGYSAADFFDLEFMHGHYEETEEENI